jgi:hypothetical protein
MIQIVVSLDHIPAFSGDLKGQRKLRSQPSFFRRLLGPPDFDQDGIVRPVYDMRFLFALKLRLVQCLKSGSNLFVPLYFISFSVSPNIIIISPAARKIGASLQLTSFQYSHYELFHGTGMKFLISLLPESLITAWPLNMQNHFEVINQSM